MGRKKLKKSEQVVTVYGYVKRKYRDRVEAVIKNEISKINAEEAIGIANTIQDN